MKRRKLGILARVLTIEYDPNRTAKISLIVYLDGEKSYILSPSTIEIGSFVSSDFNLSINTGNHTVLSRIPVGTLVHNVEFQVLIKYFLILFMFYFSFLMHAV